MDSENIKLLVTIQKESSTVEFKTSTANLKAAFETVCAFLNSKGGKVMIGINDKGKLIGQDITDNTCREIAREIKKIEPCASVDVQYIEVKENKYVIVISVNPGDHAPYLYDGRPFQRNESETSRMSQHRYEQLLVRRGQLNHSWEEMTATAYRIDDLDQEEIYKTVAEGIQAGRIPAGAQRETITEILERLNLITENGLLKQAAVVLYAKQESLRLMQCRIKMARFKGLDKLGDFIDNQQIMGNSFYLLSGADAFLRRHLPIASFFEPDQLKRIDKPILPTAAIREALINSVCHRNYADQQTDISLAIFNDHIELWNSGSLSTKLTIEDLRLPHQSIPRNKLIANVFYVRGLIEKWGIGTNKMITLCTEEGLPEPQFKEEFDGLSVIFRFKEPIAATTVENRHVAIEELTIRQHMILDFIKEAKTATSQQILDHLAQRILNIPTRKTILRDLKHLKSLDFIELKGRSTGAIWVYRNQ